MGAAPENRWWADEAKRPEVFDVDPETGFTRRFFDVDDLAAVRMEKEEVFHLAHDKVLALLAEGVLDGLRVDHPDGLADPAGYLQRLHDAGAERVWVEKILHPGEQLPDWPVSGTVGYEFLNDVLGLYVDPGAERSFLELWAELTGDDRAFAAVALEAQLQQAEGTFQREVDWLVRLSGGRFEAHDIARSLSRLPVYRTYVEPWSGRVSDADREHIAAAEMPEDLARVLLLEEGRDELDEFVTRFQQTSPPVTAKGIEDTTFYRWMPMVALNEVGGDPSRFGLSVDAFHEENLTRAKRFGEGLLVTQTHDTKRSGDLRARIAALTTMPGAWEELVRAKVSAEAEPTPAEQLFALQIAVGLGGEITRERLDGYLEKALREGKTTSNWIEPDEAHERAVQEWAWGMVSDPDVLALAERAQAEGERAALGHTLLKLTTPGVPDVYQGDELWMLALVDPDNRRPVDWAARREALDAVKAGAAPTRETAKLHLLHRGLALRARREDAFGPHGAYTPLEAGPGVCAFTRGIGEVLVVAPVRDWDDRGARRARGPARPLALRARRRAGRARRDGVSRLAARRALRRGAARTRVSERCQAPFTQQARRVADREAADGAARGLPAGVALRPARGVEAQAGHDHERVAGVRVDRHPLAGAGLAEGHERPRGHRGLDEAGRRERVGDRARAVVGRVGEGALRAARLRRARRRRRRASGRPGCRRGSWPAPSAAPSAGPSRGRPRRPSRCPPRVSRRCRP